MKMKCSVCGEWIDPKYGFIYYYKEKKNGERSKRKTYEHIGCSDVLK